MPDLAARPASDSRTVLSVPMGISDANLSGNVHGGVIMRLVDEAGGMAAARHSNGRVVTAAMDEMSFLHPVLLGDLVILTASVNDVGKTSMEVGVRVEAEKIRTGERVHTSTAYLVFVALDADANPRPVPPLLTETPEERRRQREAAIRRQARLARKDEILKGRES